MDYPNISADLDGVEGAKSIATIPERDLEHATINILEQFRLIRLAASAAIVSAPNMSLCTSSGNSSKSLRAAFNHEIGLMFLIELDV